MDFLKVSKEKIVNQTDTPVTLRGVCVGGFMNLEDFINGYSGTESNLRGNLTKVLGDKLSDYFFEQMADQFFNEEDIAFLSGLGANCIRIPLNYRHFEDDLMPFRYKEKGFQRLDHIIDLCEAYGIYVILDMHSIPGWQNCHWHSDNERGANLLWTHKHFQDRLVGLWEEFARRYHNRSIVAGYDLMNEPSTGNPSGEHGFDFYEHYNSNWNMLNEIYQRIITAIRVIDQQHIIFLEGDNYARNFDGLSASTDQNVAYSSHNYTAPSWGPKPYPGEFMNATWNKGTHEKAFLEHEGTVLAKKHQVPLWVGEFGSQYLGPVEQVPYRLQSMDDQLDVYSKYDIHFTTWTYKDAGVMGLVTLDPESEYIKLIKPIQDKKKILGCENFVALFEKCPGREKSKELADLILQVTDLPDIKESTVSYSFDTAALNGYAAATLQISYVNLWKGMMEADIKRIMEAFRLKNCKINQPFLEILKKHFAAV